MAKLQEDKKGGRSNTFLGLKDGDKKRVRFIFEGPVQGTDGSVTAMKQSPFGSWWHKIAEDKEKGRKYHEWLCIGQYHNCPLCIENTSAEVAAPPRPDGKKMANSDKPWPLKKKIDINAWSYEHQKVLIVSCGRELWDKLVLLEETKGKDIDMFDIILTRKGQGFQTNYDAIPDADILFALPAGNFIFNLELETSKSERTDAELNEVVTGELDKKYADRAPNGSRAASAPPAAGDTTAASNAIITFGAHQGKKLGDVFKAEPAYVAWMMQNSADPGLAQAAAILVNAAAAPKSPPPPPAPAAPVVSPPPPAAPAAPAPADMFAAAASLPEIAPVETIESLQKKARDLAMSKPEYRDPKKLAEKLKSASGGIVDINKFTIEQLRKLIEIL